MTSRHPTSTLDTALYLQLTDYSSKLLSAKLVFLRDALTKHLSKCHPGGGGTAYTDDAGMLHIMQIEIIRNSTCHRTDFLRLGVDTGSSCTRAPRAQLEIARPECFLQRGTCQSSHTRAMGVARSPSWLYADGAAGPTAVRVRAA
jgi:hypothetical protein